MATMTTPTEVQLPLDFDWKEAFSIADQEFRALRKQFTRRTCNNREFILVCEITRCLQEKSESCPQWLESNLRWLYVTAHHSHYRDALDLRFDELERRYLTIFYILTDLGYPQYIRRFREHGLDDGCLPISDEKLEKITAGGWGGITDFQQEFDERQYAWCPVMFDLNMGKNYYKQIIPLVEKKPITRGVLEHVHKDSTLWKVGIPKELVGPALRDKLSSTKNGGGDIHLDGTATLFECVLKQFPSSMEESWSREIRTTEAFKGQTGVLQCIGWFRNLEEKDKDSPHEEFLNIVLESGEMDLNAFMTNMEPPGTSSEVLAIWQMMLNVTCGLNNIHRLRSPELADINYNVCHGDIKPENLVAVDGLFKIADAGEARVEISTSLDNPQTSMTGGTLTYASPEKSQILRQEDGVSADQKISLKSDIWSLGCVFSDVATWVVLGSRGFITYNQLRLEANHKHTGIRSDSFHDGHTVLTQVTKWHEYLRRAARGTDRLTHRILDIVDGGMLVNETDRHSALGIIKIMVDEIGTYEYDVSKSFNEFYELEDILVATNSEIPSAESRNSTGYKMADQMGGRHDRGITGLPRWNDDFKSSRERLLSQPILPTIQRNDQRQVTRTVSHVPTIDTGNASYSFENKGVVDMWMVEAELEAMQRSKNLSFLRSIRSPTPKSVKDKKSRSKRDELESFSKDRDIVFLVDNSPSMLKHWNHATYLTRVLAWRALGYDENGMELYFTNPKLSTGVKQRADQKVADFVRAMQAGKPSVRLNESYHSVTMALRDIFNRYNETKRPRPMTIMVLTDGAWENILHDGAVDDMIRGQINHLIDKGEKELSESRPLTFQFIRFGHHPEGMKRLERLDDHLEDENTPDLVDTEPATGDVYKMFLGSLSKEMDGYEHIVNTPRFRSVSSPSPSPLFPSPSRQSSFVIPSLSPTLTTPGDPLSYHHLM